MFQYFSTDVGIYLRDNRLKLSLARQVMNYSSGTRIYQVLWNFAPFIKFSFEYLDSSLIWNFLSSAEEQHI